MKWRLPFIVFILLIWANLLGTRAFYEGAFLDYNPINGDFQTYNPLRRMSAGEMPGRDFHPYLGLGTTYATYLPYKLLGENFSASKTGSFLVHGVLFGIGNFVLLMLLGASGVVALALSFLVYLYAYMAADFLYMLPFGIAATESGLPFAQTFRALAAPENSCLGIRTALPLITAGILLLCYRRGWLKNPRAEAITWGVLSGLQVAWSNDYGFVSAALLVAIYNIYIARGNWAERIAVGSTQLLAAVAAAIFIITLATGFYPHNWLHYNFSGVAKDQFWYFMFDEKDKIFSPAIFLRDPKNLLFLSFLLVVGGGLAVQQFFSKRREAEKLLLIFVIGATLAAGILSSIGGGFMWRYFSATVRLAPFVLLWLCWLAARPLVKWRPESLLAVGTLVAAAGFFYFFTPISLWNYSTWVTAKAGQNYFYNEETGGYLPESQKGEIAIALKIRDTLKDAPPEKRLFSTYSTLADAVSGSFQASHIDYIIHALGSENRRNYLAAFDKWKPAFISTPREDFSLWEVWSRRVNWWFYREMLPLYEPVMATPYHLFWQRRAHPAAPVAAAHFTCKMEGENFTLTDDGTLARTPHYVELIIRHDARVRPSGVPVIGSRGLLTVTEMNSALDGFRGIGLGGEDNRSYNAPMEANPLIIMVEHQPGSVSRVVLKASPEPRAKLNPKGCSVGFGIVKPVIAPSRG